MATIAWCALGTQAALAGDFDGDGRDDAVIGIPYEDLGTITNAGAVQVLYGSSSGLRAARNQFWTQNSAGIADVAEPNDFFGTSFAAGDFDGDGFDDLAVGVPGEDLGSLANAGAVHVLYGSPSGLTSARSQRWTQTSSRAETSETGDNFGTALAAANFGNGARKDLAVGAPFERVGGVAGAGAVDVIFGGPAGLATANSEHWTQDSPGILDTAEAQDAWGYSLAAANFGFGPASDLAVAAPSESLPGSPPVTGAGAVSILFGSPGGLSGANDQRWTQNSSGIRDLAETSDFLGGFYTGLAGADFDGDGWADLAAGVPGEDLGSNGRAGAVMVLYGSSTGLRSARNQFWNQNSSGIANSAETGDEFGRALAVGNAGHGAKTDLVIGAPGESFGSAAGAGAVHVLYGSATGLAPAGSQFWSQNSTGILDAAESNDSFGWSLAVGNFGRGGVGDLLVGVPGESPGGISSAGAAGVLYGTSSGLTATGNQLWHQNVDGILDRAEAGDFFGLSAR